MLIFFFFKQKTAYEMRISDWSSDVCSSDLILSYGCTKHSKRWSGPISRRAKRVPRSQAPARENRKKSGRRRTPQISAMRNSPKRAQAVRGGVGTEDRKSVV